LIEAYLLALKISFILVDSFCNLFIALTLVLTSGLPALFLRALNLSARILIMITSISLAPND